MLSLTSALHKLQQLLSNYDQRVTTLESIKDSQAREIEQLKKDLYTCDLSQASSKKAWTKRKENLTNKFSIIYIDLCFLTKHNNTYGHVHGDDLLSFVGNFLVDNVRQGEVYHMSGDEFMIYFDGNNVDLKSVINRLETILEQHRSNGDFNHCFDTPLELAMGGVTAQHGDNKNTERILERADEIMYLEKDRIHAKYNSEMREGKFSYKA